MDGESQGKEKIPVRDWRPQPQVRNDLRANHHTRPRPGGDPLPSRESPDRSRGSVAGRFCEEVWRGGALVDQIPEAIDPKANLQGIACEPGGPVERRTETRSASFKVSPRRSGRKKIFGNIRSLGSHNLLLQITLRQRIRKNRQILPRTEGIPPRVGRRGGFPRFGDFSTIFVFPLRPRRGRRPAVEASPARAYDALPKRRISKVFPRFSPRQ